jgi:hypothetical protein
MIGRTPPTESVYSWRPLESVTGIYPLGSGAVELARSEARSEFQNAAGTDSLDAARCSATRRGRFAPGMTAATDGVTSSAARACSSYPDGQRK